MFIRSIKVPSSNGTVHEYIRIVGSVRENGKVKQQVIANLGRRDTLETVLPQLIRFLKGEEEPQQLARELGLAVLNLDLRDTQRAAIGLYESLGYRRWGTHPVYAQVEGRIMPGHYYYKLLDDEPATP